MCQFWLKLVPLGNVGASTCALVRRDTGRPEVFRRSIKAGGGGVAETQEPLTEPRVAVAALFGPWQDLRNFTSIDDILDHFSVAKDVWRAFELQMGSPGAVLAALPKVALVAGCGNAGCGNALTSQGPFTPIQATQVGLVWGLSRRILAAQSNVREEDFMDIDPWQESDNNATGDAARQEPQARQSSGAKEMVLKMNVLMTDGSKTSSSPWDHSQTRQRSPRQLSWRCWRHYTRGCSQRTKHLIATFLCGHRTPFERRMSRIQKCTLGDGSYLQKDLPRPAAYAAWKASWGVFRTACIMLNICSLASLEAYAKQVEKFTTQWPRCWGLIPCR